MDKLQEFVKLIKSIWKDELFQLGKATFTLGSIFYFLISLFALFYLSAKLRNLLVNKIFVRYHMDIGVSQSIGAITRYVLITIGLVIIIQSTGIDLSSLGILVGALGVGIGFGLQNITNNFISGIIILFERPVKIGDRIEVGDIAGNIIKISGRATTIITNDNIAIIVPNSEFISSKVINWSLNDRNVRFNFPIRVSYKEDPERIKNILLEITTENKGVLSSPKPDVLFDEYGESCLKFNLRVWTSKYSDRPNVLKSQLYYAVFKKFKEHHIEIPFPQRDLHLKSGFSKSLEAPIEEVDK